MQEFSLTILNIESISLCLEKNYPGKTIDSLMTAFLEIDILIKQFVTIKNHFNFIEPEALRNLRRKKIKLLKESSIMGILSVIMRVKY